MKQLKLAFILMGVYVTFAMVGDFLMIVLKTTFALDKIFMFWGGALWWYLTTNEKFND
jgi:hypothetical protein